MTLTQNTASLSRRVTLPDRLLLPIRNEVRVRKYLPFEVRVRLRSRVLKLTKLSMSYLQIQSEIFDSTRIWLSKGSISEWVRGVHNPSGGKNRFRAIPSPELGYVIGVIAGDGNLNVHGYNYEILLSVTDRDFAEEFRQMSCEDSRKAAPLQSSMEREEEEVDSPRIQHCAARVSEKTMATIEKSHRAFFAV